MNENTEQIPFTEEEIQLLRWIDHGASGWERALFGLCAVSDGGNLATLAKAYPAHVAAYYQWTRGDLAQRARTR